MKNVIKSTLSLGLLVFASCTGSVADTDLESSDIVTDTTETFTYQLPDGKHINVAYTFKGNDGSALLDIDGKQHVLPQKTATDSMSVYQKDKLSLKNIRTKLFLSIDDSKEEELVLISPLFETYQSDKEDILAVYHPIDKQKPYVVLQREDGNEYKLLPKEADAKGATYSNDTLIWKVSANEAALQENGKVINFKLMKINEEATPLHQ